MIWVGGTDAFYPGLLCNAHQVLRGLGDPIPLQVLPYGANLLS